MSNWRSFKRIVIFTTLTGLLAYGFRQGQQSESHVTPPPVVVSGSSSTEATPAPTAKPAFVDQRDYLSLSIQFGQPTWGPMEQNNTFLSSIAVQGGLTSTVPITVGQNFRTGSSLPLTMEVNPNTPGVLYWPGREWMTFELFSVKGEKIWGEWSGEKACLPGPILTASRINDKVKVSIMPGRGATAPLYIPTDSLFDRVKMDPQDPTTTQQFWVEGKSSGVLVARTKQAGDPNDWPCGTISWDFSTALLAATPTPAR